MSSYSFPLVYVVIAMFDVGLQLGGGLNTGLKTDGLKGIGQQPTSLGLGLG